MSSYGYYVERQPWTHWPKVLIMRHRTGQGPDETRRYVPERTCELALYEDTGITVCSECGAVQPDDWTVYYCWSCGRRVVEVDE
jgi:hypothetical protein